MPMQKDLKRLVRARMTKTGESYTTARMRLLEKRPAPRERTPAASSPPAMDLGTVAGIGDDSVLRKTGRDWKRWVAELDRAGGATRPHRELARLLREEYALPSWWAQMVTVGYERIRGLRERGQKRDGTFAVNKSKVFPVPLPELWLGFVRCDRWLDGAKLRMSTATRHKVMRMRWTDGTPVEALFSAKGERKSQVAITHSLLASRAEAARLRTFWSGCLARLDRVLTEKE
jgi:hypothetical protein